MYFITLNLEKEIIVLEKFWKKSCILDKKSVRTLVFLCLLVEVGQPFYVVIRARVASFLHLVEYWSSPGNETCDLLLSS